MTDAEPLRFGVPDAPARPGEMADFSYLDVPAAGRVRRPETDTPTGDTRYLAFTTVRVPDADAAALGAWSPEIDDAKLHEGLHALGRTRAYDGRVAAAQ